MKTTMKIAVIAMMGMSLGVKAQQQVTLEGENDPNFVNKNGKVGIGTTNPSQRLEVKGNLLLKSDSYVHYAIERGNGAKSAFGITSNTHDAFLSSSGNLKFLTNNNGTNWNTAMFLNKEGNLGIGTTNPGARLHLNKSVSNASYPSLTSRGDIFQLYTNVNQTLEFGVAGRMNTRRSWILSRHYDLSGRYGKYYSTLHLQPDTGDKSQYKGIAIGYPANQHIETGTHLAVNGKVGIGTTQPDMELTVNGKIHAKEVKIDLAIPAPDYVFKSDYKLRSIEEVESFIKENSHLPEIPSAKEFAENGVMQAEMDMNLLKKIEELTLYTIAQEKEIQELKKAESEITKQKKEIEKLKKQTSEIKELKALVQKLLKDRN